MKKFAILALLAIGMIGCQPDNNEPSNPDPGDVEYANHWIYNTMRSHYLWDDDLPPYATSGVGRFSAPQYFENLRYRSNHNVPYYKDTYGDRFSRIDKYSSLTRAGETGNMNYGSGFFPVAVSDGETGEILYLQVLYVTPGSPADGKLERGDAFRHINGTLVTNNNIGDLLTAQSTMAISVFDIDNVGTRTVTVDCNFYYDHPIIADIIYPERNTAYLAYTHFVSSGRGGPEGSSEDLRQAFTRYKDAGVRNLILDLRYNGGGELTAATLLASLMARNSDLGQTLGYLRNNKNYYEPIPFLQSSEVPENADIETLVVLTSESSASASELIIHCLKPFFGENLIVVGERTAGKNLGGSTFTDQRAGWALSIMQFMVYDKDKISGYETGKAPDISVLEYGNYPADPLSPVLDLGELGDYIGEHQLNVAMHHLFPDIPLTEFVESGSPRARSTQGLIITPYIPERNLTL